MSPALSFRNMALCTLEYVAQITRIRVMKSRRLRQARHITGTIELRKTNTIFWPENPKGKDYVGVHRARL
jgi:hypothetical protein